MAMGVLWGKLAHSVWKEERVIASASHFVSSQHLRQDQQRAAASRKSRIQRRLGAKCGGVERELRNCWENSESGDNEMEEFSADLTRVWLQSAVTHASDTRLSRLALSHTRTLDTSLVRILAGALCLDITSLPSYLKAKKYLLFMHM